MYIVKSPSRTKKVSSVLGCRWSIVCTPGLAVKSTMDHVPPVWPGVTFMIAVPNFRSYRSPSLLVKIAGVLFVCAMHVAERKSTDKNRRIRPPANRLMIRQKYPAPRSQNSSGRQRPKHEPEVEHSSFQNRHAVCCLSVPTIVATLPLATRTTIGHEQNTSGMPRLRPS